MLDFALGIGQFALQTAIIVVALIVIIGFIASLLSKEKQGGDLKITHLNKKLQNNTMALQKKLMGKKEFKKLAKQNKNEAKKDDNPKTAFVLHFEGDIKASAVEQLRQEITTMLSVAKKEDRVVLIVESPGGMVHGYGLAASQLQRIKDAGLHLTICVDKIAASGGYMMACIADRIVAAPFSIIGSIGVVAQIPNFHRLLKKNDIDVELMTAGEYKRTLTMLGENTEKGREKFQQELEDTHQLFKDFVRDNRRGLDLDKVATGEHWFGSQAKELGLVDEIMTSDELLQQRKDTVTLYQVNWEVKRKLGERLGFSMEATLQRVIEKIWHRGSQRQIH